MIVPDPTLIKKISVGGFLWFISIISPPDFFVQHYNQESIHFTDVFLLRSHFLDLTGQHPLRISDIQLDLIFYYKGGSG